MNMEGGGDMDSLFEGMVLFNPAGQIEEPAGKEKEEENQQLNQSDDAPAAAASSSSSALCSQPLDENIFSDLTLVVVDPIQNDHNLLQSQSSSSHQHQRRRKRSGLRIGYGRDRDTTVDVDVDVDVDLDVDPSPSPPPPPPPHIPDSLVSTVTQQPSSDVAPAVSVSATELKNESRDASNDEEETFRKIRETIHEKLSHARQLLNSASSARKDAIRSRRKAFQNANLASLKYMELENQLEQACEAEDFETAEMVSQHLSASEKDKQICTESLRQADAFIDALDLKLQHALDSHIAAEEESATLLHHYATNAVNNADSAMKKATSLHSKEIEQWFSSSEALEVKKMELEIESHFISEAHTELNNNIEHSIEDDKKEKEILCKRKSVLMDELEKLLALVKQKEKEIADNDSDLKAVEHKINNVVSGFEEIQSTIEVKYGKLQSVLAQVKLETETLSLKKDKIDNLLVQEERMGAKLREFARVSEEEAKGYREIVKLRRSLMSSILKSGEDKLRLTNNEEKLSGEVKLFQQEVSAARGSLQELSSRKSSIQQDIASFKQRIIFIDKRVPELEAEKKVATAARNFKEAARIASEAKSLCVEKENIQMGMDTATSNLEKLEEEIKGTLDKLQETEGMILLKEKELAMARYQKLLLTAATARAEKAAAQEMGDVEEANLLLAEAEAADCEAERIRSTYNFKAEDISNLRKDLISMDLVSILDKKQLEKLVVTSSI